MPRDRERDREVWRAWYERNQEAYRAKRRADYHAQRDHHRARLLARQKEFPEYYADAARNYRARRRSVFVEHVSGLVVLERDDGVCGVCGGDVDPTSFHVDHIVPLAQGGEHSYANVQAAHPACNIGKGDRLTG